MQRSTRIGQEPEIVNAKNSSTSWNHSTAQNVDGDQGPTRNPFGAVLKHVEPRSRSKDREAYLEDSRVQKMTPNVLHKSSVANPSLFIPPPPPLPPTSSVVSTDY